MTGSTRLFTPGNALAALAILAAVALVLLRAEPAKLADAQKTEQSSLVVLELQTKMLAGVARMVDRNRALAELDQLSSFMESAAGRRALACFEAYVRPPESRGQAVDRLPSPGARDTLDALVARAISRPSELTPEERATLLNQMGWFARLVLATTDADLEREVGLAARKALITTGLASLAILVALGLGTLILLLGIVRRRQGALPFRLAASPERAHLYFQAFAVYLWGMLLFSSITPPAGSNPLVSLAASAGAIALSLALGISYPLLRGVGIADWRADLGLNAGRGLLREAGAGILAYLAMLPVLAAGVILTLILHKVGSHFAGEAQDPISHPLYGMIPGSSPLAVALLFLVASVLGPFVEETMFRGAFYGALRSRTGRLVSLLIMSFIFAALHPQGVVAIPSLMAVAISFGMMREWRSSLVAGAVTHGLHNGALLVGVLVLLS